MALDECYEQFLQAATDIAMASILSRINLGLGGTIQQAQDLVAGLIAQIDEIVLAIDLLQQKISCLGNALVEMEGFASTNPTPCVELNAQIQLMKDQRALLNGQLQLLEDQLLRLNSRLLFAQQLLTRLQLELGARTDATESLELKVTVRSDC